MKLFETRFSFQEVLALKPGNDNAVTHELTDLAWHQWHEAEPGAFTVHDENAYATIDVGAAGYIVTIQVRSASIDLQKEREIYIATSGELCPVCKSGDLQGAFVEIDGGGASQEITCGKCGSTWVDQYSLVRIEDLLVNEGRE